MTGIFPCTCNIKNFQDLFTLGKKGPFYRYIDMGKKMTKLKAYVASRLKNYKEVMVFQDKLRKLGYEITCDWAKMAEKTNGYDTPLEEQDEVCRSEIEGVKACDIFIMMSPKELETPRCGAYVEMGVAIANKKTILLWAEPNTMLQFYDCYMVDRYSSEGEILSFLEGYISVWEDMNADL